MTSVNRKLLTIGGLRLGLNRRHPWSQDMAMNYTRAGQENNWQSVLMGYAVLSDVLAHPHVFSYLFR